jgi:hypothetical protein
MLPGSWAWLWQRCRSASSELGRQRFAVFGQSLVRPASALLGNSLGSACPRAEIFRQIIQERAAVGFGNDRTQTFHFVELDGPLLAGQVLLGDASGIVTLRAGGLDLRLHGTGRQRLAGSARGLRTHRADGREQNHG